MAGSDMAGLFILAWLRGVVKLQKMEYIDISLTVMTSDPHPVPNPVNHRPSISTVIKLSKSGMNWA